MFEPLNQKLRNSRNGFKRVALTLLCCLPLFVNAFEPVRGFTLAAASKNVLGFNVWPLDCGWIQLQIVDEAVRFFDANYGGDDVCAK